eukprot:GFUD01008718.1.p1 GENE.GFUD01008718.1~~GFUD01008718.1.p1  ORF type:complete len:555 (+),score=120.69 GFUD01008718.1:44-1708(+)
MPCSFALHPSSYGVSSGSISSYNHVNRQLDSSLIFSRLSGAAGVEEKENKNLIDMTPLAFKLRREERRRKLFRNSSLRKDEKDDKPIEKTQTVVKDKLGNDVYIRGEKAPDKSARELDQWMKKMKCNVSTGMKLEQFKDIKVGVYQSEVIYGSPSHEPYPDMTKENFTFKGGRDRERKFHGRGTVEFEDDGSTMSGMWEHGLRHGGFKIETSRNGVCFIESEYRDNKMNGKTTIKFMDDSWLEGFSKDGVLHGFSRHFDVKNRLMFIGMYRNGRPFGTCWKIIRGGGCVVGKVDEDGKLSGTNLAYLYPDFKSALIGTFKDGVMVFAQAAQLTGYATDNSCIKIPQFTEPDGRLYQRELSTHEFVTTSPTLADPYETVMVEVKQSKVEGANDGIFARKNTGKNVILAFYNGIKLIPNTSENISWDEDSYKIFDPSRTPHGTIDIMEKYRDIKNYCATLAHKTNHSFVPNCEFLVFDHPRWGVIPCIASIHTIAAGEEIFVRYGYDLDYCPDWYLDAWERGAYTVPDSMKSEYGTNPAWADSTNDDKANQLPDEE